MHEHQQQHNEMPKVNVFLQSNAILLSYGGLYHGCLQELQKKKKNLQTTYLKEN
jgi:hypothetical protein